MSRVDVTLRLCWSRLGSGGGLLRLSALVSATRGTRGEERGRGVFWGKIEGGRRGDGGQLKDHPMRGDLKARARFYECGLSDRHVHAHTDTCIGTHT